MSEAAMPGISVIIPCYKQGHFLAGAIDSVLGQTYPEVEVIVVDDGSPDETPAVASRYGDRIVYIRKENEGLSAARNTGILAAKGEFLVFLDSDDSLRPDALERHVEAIRAHPTASVFYSASQVIDREGRELEFNAADELDPDPFHALLEGNRFPPNAHLIRRSAFARVGFFDVRVLAGEDWDMWLRLAAANFPFVAVPGAVALYRSYPDSLSKSYARMWRPSLEILDRSRTYHGNCSLCDRAVRRGRQNMHHWCFYLMTEEMNLAMERRIPWAGLVMAVRSPLLRIPCLAPLGARELYRYLIRMAVWRARRPLIGRPESG